MFAIHDGDGEMKLSMSKKEQKKKKKKKILSEHHDTLSVTIIVIGNRIDEPSPNPDCRCLCFTLRKYLWNGMDSSDHYYHQITGK